VPEITRRAALSLATSLAASAGQGDKLVGRVQADHGRIDPATVGELLRGNPQGIDELMVSLLPQARLASRPPLSDYHVGAVIQGASHSLYLGANIEVPGQTLGLAVHAEQAAIANAYMHGENSVTALAVTAAPCGHCRQFLNEMAPDGALRILLPGAAPTTLAALLPMAFGPKDLGRTQGALPIHELQLSLPKESRDNLVIAALAAARRSYSPYTKSPSGVAVLTAAGRIFAGSYIENVAFNPSLSPLQTALAGLFADGENATSIVRVILIEAEDARISQHSSTQATLASLAPSAKLEILRAGYRKAATGSTRVARQAGR
jgi:cytidine deaminase